MTLKGKIFLLFSSIALVGFDAVKKVEKDPIKYIPYLLEFELLKIAKKSQRR